jgi:hypothetical protein
LILFVEYRNLPQWSPEFARKPTESLQRLTPHDLVDASTSGKLRQVMGAIITKIQMTHD